MIRVPSESFSVAIESRNGAAPAAPRQGCQHPRPASLGTVGRVGRLCPPTAGARVLLPVGSSLGGGAGALRGTTQSSAFRMTGVGTPHRRWRAAPPRQPVAAAVSFDRFDLRGGGVAPGSGAVFRATRRTWGPTVGETLVGVIAARPCHLGWAAPRSAGPDRWTATWRQTPCRPPPSRAPARRRDHRR